MSIDQPLPGVRVDFPPVDSPPVDFPPVDLDSDELVFDESVELVVLDVSGDFFVPPSEPAVSAVVDVPPEPESELDVSLFDAEPAFDELRLSVL
jgi:hypothetical protein